MPVTAARCWDRVMSEAGRIPTFLGLMLQKGRQRVNESTEMCEIQTTMRYYFTPTKMVMTKDKDKTENNNSPREK